MVQAVKGKQAGKEFSAGATNSADVATDGTIEVPTTDVTDAQAAAPPLLLTRPEGAPSFHKMFSNNTVGYLSRAAGFQ